MDKQRGISVVLEGEGGAGDLKGDIQKSGLDGCEDDSISHQIYLKQANYFMGKGLTRKALDRLNIALRLEPESTGRLNLKSADYTIIVLDILCARSRCHLKMGSWRSALADAKSVLSRCAPH